MSQVSSCSKWIVRSRQSQTSHVRLGSVMEMRAHHGFIHSHAVHVCPHQSRIHQLSHLKLQCALYLKVSISDFPQIAATVVEAYNTVLCVHSLTEHMHVIVVVDNETMYDSCRCNLDTDRLSAHLLEPPARAVHQLNDGISSFDGTLNVDVIEFQTSLEPNQRIHFVLHCDMPMISADKAYHEQLSRLQSSCRPHGHVRPSSR